MMIEPEAPAVGQRIRAIREQKSLSLRKLSERSGLSVNAISLIERGCNSPTVTSLHLLAKALYVPITDFFETPDEQSVVFVKPGQRLSAQADGISMESLGIGLPNQRIEPFLITVNPGSGNMDEPIVHSGEEFVLCIEGSVDYYVNDQKYVLEVGYSLLFDSMQPHCFYNPTDADALLVMVFQANEDGHIARRSHLVP